MGGVIIFNPVDVMKPGWEIRFYNSGLWKAKRTEILKRDRWECAHCRMAGIYTKADCVHHIIHLKDNPSLALSNQNLVSLCNICHNLQHPEKLGHEVQFTNQEWF